MIIFSNDSIVVFNNNIDDWQSYIEIARAEQYAPFGSEKVFLKVYINKT